MNDHRLSALLLIPAVSVPRWTGKKQTLRFRSLGLVSLIGILSLGFTGSPGDSAIAAESAAAQEKKTENRKSEDGQQQDAEPKKKQERAQDQSSTSKKSDVAKAKEIAPSEESLALEFARTHHPELATLLVQLQKSHPREYRAALTELERTRTRLERDRERLPERYALELEKWKLDSRVRLLVARMSMSESDELKAELRTALQDRMKLSDQLLQDEQERLQRRLAKVEEQLARRQGNRDKIIDQELNALLGSANKAASRRKETLRKREEAISEKGARPKAGKPDKATPLEAN